MAGHRRYAGDASSPELESERRDELELGLTLGGACRKTSPAAWGQSCRILTAENFPSLGSRAPTRASSTSSVSSSPATVNAGSAAGAGPKRDAGDGSSPHSQSHMVVGWPPIGTFRINNNLFNQSKDANASNVENETAIVEKTGRCVGHEKVNMKVSMDRKSRGESPRRSILVKVNMDGDLIGRKVDLNAHQSYENLAMILEFMFHKPNGQKVLKLLDDSSEFALTYEDKDGDWMLVGDVPWDMFLDTVKRIRIMRKFDANGLAPGLRPWTRPMD